MIPAGEVHLLAHVVAAICRHMIVTFVAAGHCLGVWSQHAHRYGAPQRAHCSDRISAAVRFFEPPVELIAKRDAVVGSCRCCHLPRLCMDGSCSHLCMVCLPLSAACQQVLRHDGSAQMPSFVLFLRTSWGHACHRGSALKRWDIHLVRICSWPQFRKVVKYVNRWVDIFCNIPKVVPGGQHESEPIPVP